MCNSRIVYNKGAASPLSAGSSRSFATFELHQDLMEMEIARLRLEIGNPRCRQTSPGVRAGSNGEYGPPRGGPARAGRPPARGPRTPWPHRARAGLRSPASRRAPSSPTQFFACFADCAPLGRRLHWWSVSRPRRPLSRPGRSSSAGRGTWPPPESGNTTRAVFNRA